MAKNQNLPDVVFETSWEVCNKVGGIYTVLSSRAKTLKERFGDNLIFIGPDIWTGKENPKARAQYDAVRAVLGTTSELDRRCAGICSADVPLCEC